MSAPPLLVDAEPDSRRDLDLLALDQLRLGAWQRLLFVECGDGWIAEEAWRRAQRAYACGLDLRAGHVERAQRLRGVPGKLEFQTWDGRNLPCPDGSFHQVVATRVLEHCSDADGLLGELHRVTRPDGEIHVVEVGLSGDDLSAALARGGFDGARELIRSGALEIVHARRAASPAPTARRPSPPGDSPARWDDGRGR